MESGIEGNNLLPGSQPLHDLSVAGITLPALGLQVLDDGVCSLVLELDAALEVDELSANPCIHDGVTCVADDWRLVLVGNWLLLLLLLSTALVGRNGLSLARGRSEDELEDLERVWVLRGGSRKSECVSGGQFDLLKVRPSQDKRTRDIAYLVGRETSLIIDSYLEPRVGVLKLHNAGSAQVAVGIITVAKSETVDAAVALIVCGAVIQESTDASTLESQISRSLLQIEVR